MAYKVIDDETALLIYEAVQESTDRSFGQYNRLRQLPRTKISGEIIFYLDALLDFATEQLGRDPVETLQEVVDAGVVSFFANLDPSLQKKLGFGLLGDKGAPPKKSPKKEKDDKKADETIAHLSKEINSLKKTLSEIEKSEKATEETNAQLSKEIEILKKDASKKAEDLDAANRQNRSLSTDVAQLKREKADLQAALDDALDSKAEKDAQPSSGPAFLQSNGMGAVYTEMTTHLLTPTPVAEKSPSSKKKNHKKKKRG